MNQKKLSEFIYSIDLEHDAGGYGVWGFKTFYSRREALDFAESFAKNNPEMIVSIGIRPRMRRKNVLAS